MARQTENSDPGQPPIAADDALLGRTIAERFHVLSLLAAGGMGRVYRAEQQPLGRVVALKVLRVQGEAWEATGTSPDLSNPTAPGSLGANDQSESMRQRFLREASVCAKLKHPNTITIFDYGCTEDQVYFIAMELLEGRNLEQAINQDGHFAPERALRIAGQVCRSLREAHGIGMVHRDLKPGNVFLVTHDDDPDYVKVLDFGLVKEVEPTAQSITQTGFFVGSPCYMSPEQIRGHEVDFRTDIYSVGIIIYQMLTGKVPFREKTAMDTVVAHIQKRPPRMSDHNPNVRIPEPLEAVVMKSIAKDPDKRFASMEHLLAALQQAAAQANIPAFSGSTASGPVAIELQSSDLEEIPTRPHRRPRSRSLILTASALGIAALLAIGIFFLARGSLKRAETNAGGTPTTTRVALRSIPPGAEVRVRGETICPTTPCDLTMESQAGRAVSFVFIRKGFVGKEVERIVTGARVEVKVMLTVVPSDPTTTIEAAPPGPSPKRPRRPPPKKEPKPKKKKGYKDNPY